MTEEELLQVIEQAASEGVKELDLSGKELTVLPPEIGKLTQLKKLILGKYEYDEDGNIAENFDNQLTTLPKEIGLLCQLEELQIVSNQLISLPEEIGQLSNLQVLDLTGNELKALPAEIGKLTQLKKLILGKYKYDEDNYTVVNAIGNKLSVLPKEIGMLNKLEQLQIAKNRLSSLPTEIGQLTNLQFLELVENQLKVLLVISSPSNLAQLDTIGEEKLIREALENLIEAGQIELDVLHKATRREIQQKLREKPYNVFHFIGHGEFKDNKGYIALIDENGKAKSMDDETFANFFLGNNNLGLVILNSCQGATVSSNQAFVGTAPNLVRRGIPAVVAMQYSIWDNTAKLFADEFYRTLALGYPVDAAIQTTRNAISMDVGLDKRDFATPVLYMRAKDGIILSGL